MKRQCCLIVDGHSTVFSLPDLRRIHGSSPARARQELEKRLLHYQDNSGVSVILVFDGAGERVSSEREGGGVQVIYSDRGRTADDVVERLVAKYAGKYELTVVTDHYAEQETVRALDAFAIGVEGLVDLLSSAEREFQERLRKHRKR